MKNPRNVTCLAILFALTGCLTPSSKISDLTIGTPEAEVVRRLGKPAARGMDRDGTATLHYTLRENGSGSINAPYFVRIVDGKVESFGREGSPTTTRAPHAVFLPAR